MSFTHRARIVTDLAGPFGIRGVLLGAFLGMLVGATIPFGTTSGDGARTGVLLGAAIMLFIGLMRSVASARSRGSGGLAAGFFTLSWPLRITTVTAIVFVGMNFLIRTAVTVSTNHWRPELSSLGLMAIVIGITLESIGHRIWVNGKTSSRTTNKPTARTSPIPTFAVQPWGLAGAEDASHELLEPGNALYDQPGPEDQSNSQSPYTKMPKYPFSELFEFS